jgi:hypothetical protein
MRTRILAVLALSAVVVIAVGVALATPPSGLTPWAAASPRLAGPITHQRRKVTMYKPARRGDDDDDGDDSEGAAGCEVSVQNAGTAFAHPKGLHNFRNTAAGPTEFYIVYFVPPGQSPAPDITPPAPAGCPG